MRAPVLLAAAAIMAGGALLAAEPWHEPAAAAITNCSTNTADMNAAETEVLRLVNAERQRAGLTRFALRRTSTAPPPGSPKTRAPRRRTSRTPTRSAVRRSSA